ncbi:MAG: hypothetical protein J4F36_13585 [Nitrosopumilaceae archaeon]|nr:hypothetical protein [Nitrosopumilaceae archaeon]
MNRRVLSDFRALFNAPAKDSVFIEIEWGDITDIYGTVADGSIDSSTELSVSLLEAFEDSRVKGQSLEDALAKGQDIRIGVEEVNIKALTAPMMMISKRSISYLCLLLSYSIGCLPKRTLQMKIPNFQMM